MPEHVASFKNVAFSWKKNAAPILQIDDLVFPTGHKTFVKGPSGGGKSTLLGLLGGVLEPQTGSISVLDEKLELMSSAKRDHFRADHIGFVFQLFNLLPYLSLIENVTMSCRFSKRRLRRATERSGSVEAEAKRLLNDLGIGSSEMLDRPVIELSVGQQQRVAVARALMGSPEILIADEPTSALDKGASNTFIKLLLDECAEMNTAVIFVSHDEDLATSFDNVVDITQFQPATGDQ